MVSSFRVALLLLVTFRCMWQGGYRFECLLYYDKGFQQVLSLVSVLFYVIAGGIVLAAALAELMPV